MAPNDYGDDFVLVKNLSTTVRHGNFYKAGSNQRLLQRYYKVQYKGQEILSLNPAAGEAYFPSLHPTSGIIRLDSQKGLQTLKHQTPGTIEQYYVCLPLTEGCGMCAEL